MRISIYPHGFTLLEAISGMARSRNSAGLQGLKPLIIISLDVAAEAATHNHYL
jgi:hypothetical protein